jgi:hypothetical protein
VRDDAGIAFSGAVYDQDFVLADVDMEWPLARDEVSHSSHPTDWSSWRRCPRTGIARRHRG